MNKPLVIAGLMIGLIAAAACSSSSDDSSPSPIPPEEDSGSSGTTPAPTSTSTAAPDSSAPIVDSGGGDTGVDAGVDSCAGLAYCDDFESYTASTTPLANKSTKGIWSITTSGDATMTIDSVKPFAGKNSLHITVPNGSTGASGLLNLTKAAGLVTNNNLFGRAMVYYTKSATDDLPNGVHSWIFQGIGMSTASGKTMTLNLANGGTDYFLNYHGDTTQSAEASKTGGKPVAAAWVCMQWEYNSSGTPAADDAKVWADGVLQLEATKAAQNWNLATPFSQMQFGFTHYQTLKNAIDVYLDDFAINDAMIPCPAK